MAGLDPISSVANLVGNVIDKIWPDPTQAAQAKLALMQLQQSGQLAQLTAEANLAQAQAATNTAEASNVNWFISGWRPFVGWVCATGLLCQFIVRPLALFGANLLHHAVDFPSLDMGTLLTLLMGMLGLGGLRTAEKIQGVAAK